MIDTGGTQRVASEFPDMGGMPLNSNKAVFHVTSAVKFVNTSVLVTVTGSSNSVSLETDASATWTATRDGTIGCESEISIVADCGRSSATFRSSVRPSSAASEPCARSSPFVETPSARVNIGFPAVPPFR